MTPEEEVLTESWRAQNRSEARQQRAAEQAMPYAQRKIANELMRHQGPSWRQGTGDVPHLYGLDALSIALTPRLPQYEASRQALLNKNRGQMVTGLPPNAYENLQFQANTLPALKSWLAQQFAPLGGQPIEPITPR